MPTVLCPYQVGGVPRKQGEDRKDVMQRNVSDELVAFVFKGSAAVTRVLSSAALCSTV